MDYYLGRLQIGQAAQPHKSDGAGIRATTDMLERYPISFPNVTS